VENTRLLWRRIWVALAEAQTSYGLVNPQQVEDLAAKESDLNLPRSFEIEEELNHDLMAELKTFADQSPSAGGILHLGATSMDIKDNALVMQQKQALELVLAQTKQVLILFADHIQEWADLPVMGYTHLQAAEPTTLGYRLAGYGQELLMSYLDLVHFSKQIRGKGFTGAVGTSASFAALLGEENLPGFQDVMSQSLDLEFFPVTNQTYPRLQDYQLMTRLAGLGVPLYRLAFDLRILQSPGFGELAEPFGDSQVGSSAMPFKQNPILSEKINSLGRYLIQLPRIAWDNASHSLLERTLDDSANQRIYIPEAFLCLDEILSSISRILSDLKVRPEAVQRNLEQFGLFAGTERLLMELVKAGADRQEMHGIIRTHTQTAWEAIRVGDANPIKELLINDAALTRYLDGKQVETYLEITAYLGDCVARSNDLAKQIRKAVSN
jgi:adenylosuccinate lyase